MKKIYFFILLFFSYCISFGQFGQFASGIRINNSIYNTTGDIGATPFQGANLGTFGANSTCAKITAGEIKTWKNASANVCGAKIYWRVYTSIAPPSGSFKEIILPFGNNCNTSTSIFDDGVGACSPGDQKWKDYSLNVDFINGLTPGNYILEIYYTYTGSDTDPIGCLDPIEYISNGGSNYQANFTVSSALASSSTQTDVLCFGNSTGAIDLTVTGGKSPYTYAWTGAGVNPSSEDQSGLAAGTYSVIVTDANGCSTASLPVTITQPINLPTVVLTAQTNVLCFGNSTGAINITATGGTGAYTYDWADIAGTSNNEDRTNLPAGTYSVIVTDANGCSTASLPVTITQPAPLVITSTSNSVVCLDTTLNLFSNVISGAVGTPTYYWSGPLGFSSDIQNPSITNVSMGAAGDYTLTVTNGNGCTVSQTTTVVVNSVPNVSIDPTFTSGFVKKFTGSLVFYTFTVTNIGLVSDSFNLSYIGDSDPMDVTMDVRFLTMGGIPISATPMISAGGTYTFQLELSVQGNQPRVYNHTVVIATSNLCTNSSVSADAFTYEYNGNHPPAANGSQLEISKVAIDNTTGLVITNAIVGVPFKYKITVVNNSNKAAATNVVINDLVPASLSITDYGDGIQTGNSIRWNVGSLTKIGAGQNTVQKIITVVPTCSSLPSVSNTANVISSPPDNGLGIDAATVNTTVTDNIAPIANCKPITVYLDANGVATITESMINNGSTDNCSIQSVAISKYTFNCSNLGANNVILSVTDISGNTSTCNSVVTVVDNLAPVFTSCPTNPVPLCADSTGTYTKTGASWDALATDNCSFTFIYTLSGSTTGSGTSLNGVAFNVGTTTVTWTATDTAGNVSNCVFTVTINSLPTTPIVGTITQPDCFIATGSAVLGNLPASGTWTLIRNPGAITTTGTGTSTTISGLAIGTYTYTVSNGTCTSLASANIVISPLVTNTWNGVAWSNGGLLPTSDQNIVFTAGFSSDNTNPIIEGCTCTVTSGNVVFNPNHTLKITNWVHVNGGSLTFEDSSSLVQINDVANVGNITYKRNTTKITKMDYTYWSTPVLPFTLGGVSPNTLGDKFYSYNSSAADWQQESAATTMAPGVGYIIRGPQNFTINNPAFYEAPFVGVPNNGHYEITGIIPDRSYLLGNPYPSALDADTFLDANQNVLDGTLYFWTHNTPIAISTPDPGSGVYAYSGDDYASYNRTGGVSTAAQAPSSVPPLTGINDNIPLGKIASGQGFFGGSKTPLPSSPKIVYDNTMRVGVGAITGNNSQFYKPKKPIPTIVIKKHRIWLDLINAQGAFKQTLVGYVTDATNGYEGRFDGESYDGNDFLDFYSILQDKNLTIQGRALPFDENDEIPLGYRVAEEGTFSVVIDQTDGLLSNQPVFIEDKLTNTLFNLKVGKYTFNTAAGTFDDRFVLRYKDKTLGVDELEANDGIVALYSTNYKTLIIRNNVKDATVNSVTLFSLSGQKIAYWDVKGREQSSIQIPIKNLPAEIYIVKIKTTQGDFSKKIIIK